MLAFKKTSIFLIALFISISSGYSQFTSIEDVQGMPEGIYTFDFGDGNFQGYVDEDGWLLWLQYHHQGGTNPPLSLKQPGTSLPVFDSAPLGTNFSNVPSKWGHGSQAFAQSIPDSSLWLRWEATTSHHNRKIHFESPILGKFLSSTEEQFTPDITYINVHRPDHTAELPNGATWTSQNVANDDVLIDGPFWWFNKHSWEIRSGNRWNVDDVRNDDGSLITDEYNTIHRVWVKPVAFDSTLLIGALEDFHDHINDIETLTPSELDQLINIINIYASEFAHSSSITSLVLDIIDDYDTEIGALFTTPNTQNGFLRDPNNAPNLEQERIILVILQGAFDYIFIPEVYNQSPQFIDGVKFNTCSSFPGDIAPPIDPMESFSVPIRANFEDPWGINPSYTINGDGTEHAYRPTGLYLAPGSVATITVPASLVGKDYYIRVGAHEWDLSNKPIIKRMDRISKKFLINSTSIEVYNPLGGAISILVPYGATDGIVDISAANVIEAPFYSSKSFYTTDFNTQLSKPAPWAVFESDNVMYTIPSHSIIPGTFDLQQTLDEWDTALQAINEILGRQLISDKHDLYMIEDEIIRAGAYSIGYPMSNESVDFDNVPGPVRFIDGPGPPYEVHFHEYGHAIRISKFSGETEALVNFLYIIAMNYGLNEDLIEAVKFSFVPNTFDIDKTATHRLLSNSFGGERDISNSETNEVRYQHRGYGHYFEIVDLFGWCPLQNFWLQEYFDFENGEDHGINDQDNDSRIIRLCEGAGADLRPLLEFYGILSQNPTFVSNELTASNIPSSLTVYNRLKEYVDFVPANNAEYVDYALAVYPNLFSQGPSSNPNFGVGWHYQKSLTYDSNEANQRTTILENIIDSYFPNGAPSTDTNNTLCCIPNELCDGIDNNGDGQIDEHLVNEWIGPDKGFWFESESYWSLCQFPNSCNSVHINDGKEVILKSGNTANAYDIMLNNGAILIIQDGATVEVND